MNLSHLVEYEDALMIGRLAAHASLGELGHVRFFPCNADDPALGAHTMLIAVANRFENR